MLFRQLSGDERGFTMVTVIGALLIVTLLAVAALSYAQTDLPRGANDRDRKVAFAAAEAGAQNYMYYLSQDPSYWAKCTTGTPSQINQRWSGAGADTRQFAPVPNTTNASYAIELLPANGYSACSTTNAEATMIDTATKTFRIRVTGRAGGTTGEKRSIVVNFRRKSLLDYVYFTDKETFSPKVFQVHVGDRPTRRPSGCTTTCTDLATWANNCDRYWGDQPAGANGTGGQRQNQAFGGEFKSTSTSSYTSLIDVDTGNPIECTNIFFQTNDVIAGPFHTNDEFLCNGTPDFGTAAADKVETSSLGQTADPSPGYIGSGCTPNFIGTRVQNADELKLPPTNGALYRDTADDYRFVGRTRIKLNGTTMNVIGERQDGTDLVATGALPDGPSMAVPANGVVYVSNSAVGKPAGTVTANACGGYDVVHPYAYQTAANDGCGNLEIKGNYSANVTFTAENDIVVTDDLTRPSGSPPSPDVLVGLISNNFIRVYHPVTCSATYGCNYRNTCTNNDSDTNRTIDAAIASLNASFTVDNWHCGAGRGTLNVRGAIVQKFRGAVGRSGAGYTKNYTYDTRLQFRSPPKFLDPVESGWRIQNYTEQVPAR